MLLDKRIITPVEALLRARITPRMAPKPRMHAGLKGHLKWGLVNRQGREVRGGEQSNLILNRGLDLIASYTLRYTWQNYAVVGTGSTEPDVTQTALNNEIARTNTTITSTTTETSQGVFEYRVVKEFDFAQANGNLTEWGFAPAPSGDVVVRELFRDSFNNPITVTKTSEEKLRLDYTLELTLSPVELTPASFVIDGIGLINGKHTFTVQAGSLARFSQFARGESSSRAIHSTILFDYNYSSINQAGTGAVVLSAKAYLTGEYERKFEDVIWDTSSGNETWKSFRYGQIGTGNGWSWVFNIDEPDRFTKDNLHTLTFVDPFKVSWGRG